MDSTNKMYFDFYRGIHRDASFDEFLLLYNKFVEQDESLRNDSNIVNTVLNNCTFERISEIFENYEELENDKDFVKLLFKYCKNSEIYDIFYNSLSENMQKDIEIIQAAVSNYVLSSPLLFFKDLETIDPELQKNIQIIEATLKGLREKDFVEFFEILVNKDINLAKTYLEDIFNACPEKFIPDLTNKLKEIDNNLGTNFERVSFSSEKIFDLVMKDKIELKEIPKKFTNNLEFMESLLRQNSDKIEEFKKISSNEILENSRIKDLLSKIENANAENIKTEENSKQIIYHIENIKDDLCI